MNYSFLNCFYYGILLKFFIKIKINYEDYILFVEIFMLFFEEFYGVKEMVDGSFWLF